jgi:threonyl-tRNA synthetase
VTGGDLLAFDLEISACVVIGRAGVENIVNKLRANMARVDSDFSATPFKAKISNAEQLRVHTMLVIGGRDMEAGQVSVRLHHGGPQGAKPKGEVVADILAGIKERRG